MRPEKKRKLQQRRHWRVRARVSGTAERPRMSVCFTHKNIHVQFIDDRAGRTLAAISTLSRTLPDRAQAKANIPTATRIGRAAAEVALARGITTVVFDRGHARYHGKVKALADAARAAGLQF